MTPLLPILLFLAASPVAGVPLPPDGAVDQVFTEIYANRAAADSAAVPTPRPRAPGATQ